MRNTKDVADAEVLYLKRLEALEKAYFPVSRSKFTDEDFYVAHKPKLSSAADLRQQVSESLQEGFLASAQTVTNLEAQLERHLTRTTCTFTADDRVALHAPAGASDASMRRPKPPLPTLRAQSEGSPYATELKAAPAQHLVDDAGLDWKLLELRMPLGLNQEDVRAISSTLQRHLRGGPERVRPSRATAWAAPTAGAAQKDQGGGLKKGALMAMQLGGMPTSRMQTQLLTSWLEVKLLAIFSDLPRDDSCVKAGSRPALGPPPAAERDLPAPAGSQAAPERQAADADAGAGAGMPASFFGSTFPGGYTTTAKDVAMQFASSNSALGSSLGRSVARVAEDAALCRKALQVVGACAATAVHSLAVGCFERGLLMARLWNLQTEILEARASKSGVELTQLRADNLGLRDRLNRLEPLLEWEKTARESVGAMQGELGEARAKLKLAELERQMLLVENEKLVRHCAKELAASRKQEEATAGKLTRKLHKLEQRLTRLQHARDQLLMSVRACTASARSLSPLLGAVRGLLEDVLEEKELAALEALLPEERGKGSGQGKAVVAAAEAIQVEAPDVVEAAAFDFPGVEAAVPEEEPFAEAEAQTELAGADMEMYTKKVGGLDEALRELAALKLERSRLQQVVEDAARLAEAAALQAASREAAIAELQDQMAATMSQLQRANSAFASERSELQRRLSLHEAQFTTLCSQLSLLGIDPSNPTLPAPPASSPQAPPHASQPPMEPSEEAAARALEPTVSHIPPHLIVPEGPSADSQPTPTPPTTSARRETSSPPTSSASPSKAAAAAAGSSPTKQRKISPPKDPPRISTPLLPTPQASKPAHRNRAVAETDVGDLHSHLPPPFTNFKCKNRHVLEALVKATEVKVKPLDWVLKTIDGLYKAKISKDEKLLRAGERTSSMPQFVYSHLMGALGIKGLVSESIVSLVASLLAYEKDDLRLATFKRFLTEAYDPTTLEVFLDAWRKLQEPSKVPCLEFSPDCAAKRGDPPWVDVRKCLWISDKLLGRRSKKTTFAFAANLALQGEAATAEEVERYFVAPGYDSTQAAQVKQYEVGRGDFRKVASITFLDALCKEWARCETILREALPTIFQIWDQNADGMLARPEVGAMVLKYAPAELPNDAAIAASGEFWGACQAAEALLLPGTSPQSPSRRKDAISPTRGNASPTRQAGPSPLASPQRAASPLVGVRRLPHVERATCGGVQLVTLSAFTEAAMCNELIRAHVRLKLTPPPSLRYNEEEKEQLRTMLGLIASRHWRVHRASLAAFFRATGPLEPVLREQAALLEKEEDGAKRAITYHNILRLLIQKALDLSLQQCNPEVLVQGTASSEGFEAMLVRICKAVKVLYGCNAILEEDLLLAVPDSSPASHSELMLQRQMLAEAASVYNRMHRRMQSYAIHLLKSGGQKSFVRYVHKWREAAHSRNAAAASEQLEPSPAASEQLEPSRVSTDTAEQDSEG